jgi:hypothetical protein
VIQRTNLQLIDSSTAQAGTDEQTATERVFAHWVWMLGKNPRRTALGPTRRRTIDKALQLYDEETLLLAIEGCSASSWHAGQNDRQQEYTDLELILRDEAHVERFAADGERLRERAQRLAQQAQQQAAQVLPLHPEPDPAQVAAQREALRALAARIAGRASAGARE